MAIHVRELIDPAMEQEWMHVLREAGYHPVTADSTIRLRGVGVAHDDQSVDLDIRLLEMDGHRVLALHAPIRSANAPFDIACLASVRGNGATHIAKIDVVENHEEQDTDQRFTIIATFHLYADHLSPEELRVMLYLFLKEVDELDNQLAAIMARR